MSKSPTQLPNCLKRAEIILLIVFMISSVKYALILYRFLPSLNMNNVAGKIYLGR